MSRARLLSALEVAAVVLLAASAVVQVHGTDAADWQGGRAVHDLLIVGFTAPLLRRRQQPVAVFLLVLCATWLQFQLGGGLGQPFFAVLVALYSVGAHASGRGTFVAPAGVAVLALSDVPRLRDGAPWDEVVPAWFVLLGAWVLGRWVRHRRSEAVQLVERARAAEDEAATRSRQAVVDERARIARELHDLVAHSMGVIVLQSQGAQRTLGSDDVLTRRALESIEGAGRDGLAEMRRLLGLLSDPGAGAPHEPQPTLADLPALVDRVRSAGATVDLVVQGAPRRVAPGVELTAYRVVQEGLTNALKHAPGAPVRVRVAYAADCVEVGVADSGGRGPGRSVDSGGHGMTGMRERVRLYGGELAAGPCDDGGYLVSARLPHGGAA